MTTHFSAKKVFFVPNFSWSDNFSSLDDRSILIQHTPASVSKKEFWISSQRWLLCAEMCKHADVNAPSPGSPTAHQAKLYKSKKRRKPLRNPRRAWVKQEEPQNRWNQRLTDKLNDKVTSVIGNQVKWQEQDLLSSQTLAWTGKGNQVKWEDQVQEREATKQMSVSAVTTVWPFPFVAFSLLKKQKLDFLKAQSGPFTCFFCCLELSCVYLN